MSFETPERREFGLTLQAWNIRAKIREIDELMTPQRQWSPMPPPAPARPMLVEVHPELTFYELNGRRPLVASKRRADGRTRRTRLLEPLGDIGSLVNDRPGGASRDDVLDALAALWTAL